MADCCGYCNRAVEDWRESPHGRPYCPHCGAIRGPHQSDLQEGSGYSIEVGWS